MGINDEMARQTNEQNAAAEVERLKAEVDRLSNELTEYTGGAWPLRWVRREDADAKLTEHRHAVAAYAIDRSMQYVEDSGSRCALENFAKSILSSEHIAALEHGELDDLMAWARRDTNARRIRRRPVLSPPERDSSGGYKVSK